MPQSVLALRILFDWQGLTLENLAELTAGLDIRNVRWLARNHPNNQTRENLFRLSNVVVGERTVLNTGLFIYCYEPRVTIGKFCALAANISLVTESNPNMSELGELDFVQERFIKSGNITIEDHAWLGANVIVFPGVTIGHHAIVGAGSIVTSDVPPGVVVKGQPARISQSLVLPN